MGNLVCAQLRFGVRCQTLGQVGTEEAPKEWWELQWPHAAGSLRTCVLEEPHQEVNGGSQYSVKKVRCDMRRVYGLPKQGGHKTRANGIPRMVPRRSQVRCHRAR